MDLQLASDGYQQAVTSVDPVQMAKWVKLAAVAGPLLAVWRMNSAYKRARVATRLTRVRLRRFLAKNG